MKVIMTVASMCGGGTERVISVLANYMVQKGIDVTILMTAGNEVVYKLDKRIQIKSIGERTGGSIGKRIDRIKQIRKYYKEDPQIIVIAFGMETNLFSTLAGVGLKNKIILSERNDPNQCSFKVLRNIIYRLADGFVFQTEGARDYFGKSIRRKGVVIANPIKDSLPQAYSGERKEIITTAGRLEPQKNHELLIRAFKTFLTTHPTYRLVIYGKGELETYLKDLTEQLSIKDKVVFAGFAEDAMAKMRESAMFVLSSDYEGISNSLMEAMAIGMPVISTDCPIGGSSLLIENGQNGILVPIKDENALTSAMCQIVDDKQHAEEMASRAIKVKQEYSAESICKKWVSYISR